MCTATEFNGEVACAYNTDNIAVLFTEECHCAELFSLFNRHFLCCNGDCLKNLFIYKILNLNEFLCRERLKVSKVKTEVIV